MLYNIRRSVLLWRVMIVLVSVCSLVLFTASLVTHVEYNRQHSSGRRHRRQQSSRSVRINPEDEFNGDTADMDAQHTADDAIARDETSTNDDETARNESNNIPAHHVDIGDVTPFDYSEIDAPEPPPETMLTLFTTLKDSEDRRTIHNNTLLNWAAHIPYIQPVLFVDNSTRDFWVTQAISLGWKVLNVTRYNKGIPVLKYMFLQTMQNFSSPFYGYANADILFDASLIDTMKVFIGHANLTKKWFLVGRRINLNMTLPGTTKLDPTDLSNLTAISRIHGKLFDANAQDFFISAKRGFPWRRIPEFVVGRAGYDNYLLVVANDWNVTVVDLSYTLHAVHQTGSDGIRSGWAQQKNRCLNHHLAGDDFNFTKGRTICAAVITYKDIYGDIRILRRPNRPKLCMKITTATHGRDCKD